MKPICYSVCMSESFASMLAEDGKKNSLGRVDDVIQAVLADPARVEELYLVMFADDAWVRMRAADAFEKVCRVHPEWIQSYIDRIQEELHTSQQASIQWHIAQIYCQVELSKPQGQRAIKWLVKILETTAVDWIVAANSMKALAHFTANGDFNKDDLVRLLQIQQGHKSNAVVRNANKLLSAVS